jgi:hypothetical protein
MTLANYYSIKDMKHRTYTLLVLLLPFPSKLNFNFSPVDLS